MRKVLLGILGFAAIGFGGVTSQTAQAQYYHPGYRHGPAPVEYRGDRGGYRSVDYRRPDHDGYRGPRPGYYRPAFAGPRCVVRMDRAWNGWRWVRQPVRICR